MSLSPIDIVSGIFLAAGVFFLLTGALGIIRLPDVFTRLHAAGMTDTMGAGLILVGLAITTGFSFTTFRLVLIRPESRRGLDALHDCRDRCARRMLDLSVILTHAISFD